MYNDLIKHERKALKQNAVDNNNNGIHKRWQRSQLSLSHIHTYISNGGKSKTWMGAKYIYWMSACGTIKKADEHGKNLCFGWFRQQRDKWNEINQVKWSGGMAKRDIKRKWDGKSWYSEEKVHTDFSLICWLRSIEPLRSYIGSVSFPHCYDKNWAHHMILRRLCGGCYRLFSRTVAPQEW